MRILLPKWKALPFSVQNKNTPDWDEISKKPSNMKDLIGQPKPALFEASIEALLMDSNLKNNHSGRNFLTRTACDLFDPELCSVLHLLGLDRLTNFAENKEDKRAQLEMCNNLQVIEIDEGEQLPIKQDGMFILLTNNITATTHWKIAEGMGVSQLQYQERTRHQKSRMNKGVDQMDYAASKDAALVAK